MVNQSTDVPSQEGLSRRRLLRGVAGTVGSLVLGETLAGCTKKGTATPNSAVSPDTPGPTDGTTSSSSPSKPEAAPTPEQQLPFDQEVVNVLKKQSPEDFEEMGEGLRLQFWYADQWDALKTGKYGTYTAQTVQHAGIDGIEKLNNYNMYRNSLGTQAEGQDMVNAYIYAMAVAGANKDEATRKKLVSGFMRDPKSANYQGMIDYVTPQRGIIKETVVNDPIYTVIKTVKGKNEQGETTATVYTNGGYKFDFVFVPVKGLSEANLDKTDDNSIRGVWLNTGRKQGKISIDFGDNPSATT